jgi:hypothetical protein
MPPQPTIPMRSLSFIQKSPQAILTPFYAISPFRASPKTGGGENDINRGEKTLTRRGCRRLRAAVLVKHPALRGDPHPPPPAASVLVKHPALRGDTHPPPPAGGGFGKTPGGLGPPPSLQKRVGLAFRGFRRGGFHIRPVRRARHP